MATVKILSGIRKQDAIYMGGTLHIQNVDGSRSLYQMKEAIQSIVKLSEDKKRVLFDITLKDETTFRVETTNAIFHEFKGYEGAFIGGNFVTVVPAAKAKKQDTLIAWGIGLVLIVILYSCIAGDDQPSPPTASTNESELRSYAVVKCQNLVTASLKSPKSADFPWAMQATGGQGHYTVTSYVDAQNSFGAEIRTHFQCEFKHTGTDAAYGWEVQNFTVFE